MSVISTTFDILNHLLSLLSVLERRVIFEVRYQCLPADSKYVKEILQLLLFFVRIRFELLCVLVISSCLSCRFVWFLVCSCNGFDLLVSLEDIGRFVPVLGGSSETSGSRKPVFSCKVRRPRCLFQQRVRLHLLNHLSYCKTNGLIKWLNTLCSFVTMPMLDFLYLENISLLRRPKPISVNENTND